MIFHIFYGFFSDNVLGNFARTVSSMQWPWFGVYNASRSSDLFVHSINRDLGSEYRVLTGVDPAQQLSDGLLGIGSVRLNGRLVRLNST